MSDVMSRVCPRGWNNSSNFCFGVGNDDFCLLVVLLLLLNFFILSYYFRFTKEIHSSSLGILPDQLGGHLRFSGSPGTLQH